MGHNGMIFWKMYVHWGISMKVRLSKVLESHCTDSVCRINLWMINLLCLKSQKSSALYPDGEKKVFLTWLEFLLFLGQCKQFIIVSGSISWSKALLYSTTVPTDNFQHELRDNYMNAASIPVLFVGNHCSGLSWLKRGILYFQPWAEYSLWDPGILLCWLNGIFLMKSAVLHLLLISCVTQSWVFTMTTDKSDRLQRKELNKRRRDLWTFWLNSSLSCPSNCSVPEIFREMWSSGPCAQIT